MNQILEKYRSPFNFNQSIEMNEVHKKIRPGRGVFSSIQFVVGPSIQSSSPLASIHLARIRWCRHRRGRLPVAGLRCNRGEETASASPAVEAEWLASSTLSSDRVFSSLALTPSLSLFLARSLSLSLCSFSSPPPPSRSVGLVVCRGRWNYKVEGSGFDNKDLTTAGRKDETHRHPRRLPIGRARFLR